MYQTCVESGNIREISNDGDAAMTFAQRVFLVPDVEVAIVDACRKIAKFDISQDDDAVEEFKELFGHELEEAQQWQESKGDKAQWRRVKVQQQPQAQQVQHQAKGVHHA